MYHHIVHIQSTSQKWTQPQPSPLNNNPLSFFCAIYSKYYDDPLGIRVISTTLNLMLTFNTIPPQYLSIGCCLLHLKGFFLSIVRKQRPRDDERININWGHAYLPSKFSMTKFDNLIERIQKKIEGINLPSISNQCPVSTHIQTIDTESKKLKSSAAVKRPQKPNDTLFPSEHGRMMYWHIGSRRKARATVAMTAI